MQTSTFPSGDSSLRDIIINAYRMDESKSLAQLLPQAAFSAEEKTKISATAAALVTATREYKRNQGKIDILLHQYDLSTEEGIALMCLAEALLRIPDTTTMDKFISDKLSNAQWKNHLNRNNPLFVNAATWSLILTGQIFAPTLDNQKSLYGSLKRVISRMGITVARPIILQMMKAIGQQFVMGQDINSALERAKAQEKMGYTFSYDMLGEAARTKEDAKKYYQSYVNAIDAIGKAAKSQLPAENPGISVKLSALHPRYEYTHHETVMEEVPPMLLALAIQAKQYNIGLTVDAEEADRLDLSLDIFEKVFCDPALDHYEGFGLAVQAYQKRAPFVIDWLANLAKRQSKRIMVRLVKGAYWDAEIKLSQVQGMENYPVFTRKNSTDVSYIACAKKLLSQSNCFYSQFGTHNAYTVAALMQIAGENRNFEFQCLHGMGRPLYDQVIDPQKFNQHCRIYAPVGTHRDLLGYLVRRLLENGANSSFVNKLSDENIPIEKIIADPIARIESLTNKPHPLIPMPKDIYKSWQNSMGIDTSNPHELAALEKRMKVVLNQPAQAASIINGEILFDKGTAKSAVSPANLQQVVGVVNTATDADVERALKTAKAAENTWGRTTVEERAAKLEKAADIFQERMPELIALLTKEAGRCVLDCMSEVRETIDYCRYYAYRAREDFKPQVLPGPTGESNEIALHPRGVMACISPWNFPLAIFTGQVVAALAAGNPVLAKPAEQTPIIAYEAIRILHEAGIPTDALQLVIGSGSVVGAKIVNDPRVTGVIFTGSTETAKRIEQSLANRPGPTAVLVAETGGQNAMIVDSSALCEQAVVDISTSAFNSAGQRCSALRVLFVQEELAPKLLEILSGYMQELKIGEPSSITSDIGPVIDANAQQMLQAHFAKMSQRGKLLAQVPMPEGLKGTYFAPAAFEIDDLSILEGEVFGPILHVIKYKAGELDKVMDSIINTGFGLTLGVHSRIDATIQYITSRMPVGNMYVNRNMIGAVVGVQPFGGERLSGTGPKAGGPHYIPRLCVERTISTNTVAVGGNARLVSLLEDD